MSLYLSQVTAPSGEPLLLDEIKTHLRLSGTTEDYYLLGLSSAARRMAENELRQKLLTQTWDWLLEKFPSCDRFIRLPFGPLQSVTHVKYYDKDNVQQTWLSTNYALDAGALRPKLSLKKDISWPETYERAQAIEVRFAVGFGANGEAVPMPIRQWMLCHVGAMYENRELVSDKPTQISTFLDGLLDPYRVMD